MLSKKVVLGALLALLWSLPAQAQVLCKPVGPSVSIPLPARPYAALASSDGCKIFATTQDTGTAGSVTVATFRDGKYSVVAHIPLTFSPQGVALSHDGKLLVAVGQDGIGFVDAEKFTLLGSLDDGSKGPSHAEISPDDKLLFVSDEFGNTVTMIDLPKARAGGFKPDSIIAKIPTSTQPIGVVMSPDQRLLYAAVEIGKGEATCKDAARAGAVQAPPFAEGNLTIIDVAKKSVVAELPAGCRAIRVALSKDGKRAFISARGSSDIIAFDTEKRARIGQVKLPAASFGIALSKDGSLLYASTGSTLTLIDTASLAIKGTVPTTGSARDLWASNDGNMLVLAIGSPGSVEILQSPK
jgi:DNA-binding beta-propeller fold protein YncE